MSVKMVKRYCYNPDSEGYFDDPYMRQAENGSYVLHSDYAALLARHNALREAVAWERECDECRNWLRLETSKNTITSTAPFYDLDEIDDLCLCAGAEADQLIESDGAADCKGERG